MLAVRAMRAFDGVAPTSDGATVFVEDGKIAGVESFGAPLPDGCEEVTFAQGTLLPGLIDMHVHLGGDGHVGALDRLADYDDKQLDAVITQSMQAQLAAGVTAVRDVGDRRWSVVDWRDRIATGAVAYACPTIVASGPPITCKQGHCWSMGGEAEGVEELRRAVRERVERGVDVIKIMASGGILTPGTDVLCCQFSVDEIRAVVESAHAAGLPVTSHAHGLPAVERSVEAGVDGIEHCGCLTESGPSASGDLLESLVAGNVAICPTLGMLPGFTPPPHVQAILDRTGATREARMASVGRMLRFGVRIVSGVDAGIGDSKPHGIVALAVADLVEAGATNSEAIGTATSIAAGTAGLGNHKGRLARGYDADLLVVDGDPLRDIGDLTRVRAVFCGGSQITPSTQSTHFSGD
jgi:imidazolonepropionase-like amidohydrolase